MRLARSIQKASALETHYQTKHPLHLMYKDVLDEVAEARSHFDLANVWSNLAPAGNIYRLNGLEQMRLAHCADLQAQLRDLAEERADILGRDRPLEDRCDDLLKALRKTKVGLALGKTQKDEEIGWDDDVLQTEGFPVLEEFLVGKVSVGWPVVVPLTPVGWSAWWTSQLIGGIVGFVQSIGPVLVVLSLWQGPTNYLRDPLSTWERLTLSNTFCESRALSDWCTVLMGVMFSFFVVVQLLNYAASELEDVYKFGRLAGCTSFWSVAGAYINMWCVLWNIVALPLSFWRMEHAVDVILGSWGLLFMFNLDDLSGVAGEILGSTDDQFQRCLCWNYALLSQCPVELKDVVNPQASSADDFWIFTLTDKAIRSTRSEEKANALTRVAASEQTPLLAKSGDRLPSMDSMRAAMRFSPTGYVYNLPSANTATAAALWRMIVYVLRLMQVLLPLFFFVVNKPCLPDIPLKK